MGIGWGSPVNVILSSLSSVGESIESSFPPLVFHPVHLSVGNTKHTEPTGGCVFGLNFF